MGKSYRFREFSIHHFKIDIQLKENIVSDLLIYREITQVIGVAITVTILFNEISIF